MKKYLFVFFLDLFFKVKVKLNWDIRYYKRVRKDEFYFEKGNLI